MVVMHMLSPTDASTASLAQCGPAPAHLNNALASAPVQGSVAWADNQCAGSPSGKNFVWLPQGMLDSDSGARYGEPSYSGRPAMLMGTDGEGYPSLQQGNQPSMGNAMMMPNMWQVPEQTVISGSDASEASYIGGARTIQVMSMDALPNMAILSMDSLPTMSVMSMDNLPMVAMQQTDGRAFAVNSTDSLPSLPARKKGVKSKKRVANKSLAASEAQKARASDACVPDQTQELRRAVSEQMQQLANRRQQATQLALMRKQMGKPTVPIHQQQTHVDGAREEVMASQIVQPQVEEPEVFKEDLKVGKEDLEVVKETDVDPVMLELESEDAATQRRTLEWVVGSVWPLVLTRRGSRILQKALDIGTPLDQVQILSRLEGHVQEAMRSPHGNYVLQKCIEVVAPERVQFIIDELKGDAVVAARHRFGCRILQRLIEHCPAEQTDGITVEVLGDVGSLCRHQFGNFVVQHILQHGSTSHKKRIADVLHGEVMRLAKHRIASHVVSCAMVHCAPDDVQRLTQVVLADRGQLADLSRREYGSFVVREVNRARRLHG